MESGDFNLENNRHNSADKNLTQKTLKALFWNFSGTGTQFISQIMVLMILSRLLAPVEFGIVGTAMIVISFCDVFSQVGVGPAIIQRQHLEIRHIRTGFTVSMLLGIVFACLLSLLSSYIAIFFRIEEINAVIKALSTMFLMKGMSIIAESLLQRDLKFKALTFTQVFSYIFGYSGVGIILAYSGFGIWALVGAQLVQEAIKTIILLIIQPYPKLPQVEIIALKDLVYYGSGHTIARINNQIALQGDNFIISRWLGPESLGLYGRAYQLMAMPANLIGQVLSAVLFPVMSKIQHDHDLLLSTFRRGVSIIAITTLPFSAIMIVLAPEIIHLILGPSWSGIIFPFQVLAVGTLFRTSYKMSDSLARATGAVYRRAWRQAVYAIFVMGFAWVGHYWGINGVALGVLIAIIINFLLMAQLSLNIVSMKWKAFLFVHIPAFLLTTFLTVPIWVLVTKMRNLALPDILILIACFGLATILLVGLLCYSPRLFLGEDGIWAKKKCVIFLSNKMT